jgi:uncharacterized DUF497 family protein
MVVWYTTKEVVMAKFKYIEWLVSFLEAFDIFLFEWDKGNLTKSEDKHGVTPEQIESCFLDDKILPLGVQHEPKVAEERYGILAKDYDGKVLFVCFTMRDGKIRPVSGRLANKRERTLYEE